MKSYFRKQSLKAGDIFNGVPLTQDDILIIAENYSSTIIIRDLISNLNPTEEGQVLEVVKEVKIDSLKEENNENLETVFEYPDSSGNTFDISPPKIQNYLGLDGLKDSFIYPYEYFGNGQSSITFNSSLDITTFFAAALSIFNTVQQGRFKPAADNVKAVTLASDLITAINEVLNISY